MRYYKKKFGATYQYYVEPAYVQPYYELTGSVRLDRKKREILKLLGVHLEEMKPPEGDRDD